MQPHELLRFEQLVRENALTGEEQLRDTAELGEKAGKIFELERHVESLSKIREALKQHNETLKQRNEKIDDELLRCRRCRGKIRARFKQLRRSNALERVLSGVDKTLVDNDRCPSV